MKKPAFTHTNKNFINDASSRIRNMPKIAIGFPKTETAHIQYPDGTSVIDVAVWNNYGTNTIPERPFMDIGGRTAVKETQGLRKKLIGKIERDEIKVDDALDIVGMKAVSIVKKVIQDFTVPPNSPATIEKKKSDHPLIDTGLMVQSLTWEIRKEEEQAK